MRYAIVPYPIPEEILKGGFIAQTNETARKNNSNSKCIVSYNDAYHHELRGYATLDQGELTDYLDNFPKEWDPEYVSLETVNVNNAVSQNGIAEPNGHRARLIGMCKDTIPAGTSKDIDYKMQQLNYMGANKSSVFDGVEYYAKDGDNFDEITFQVVDKDNILGYGAGFVVEEFGDAVFTMPDSHVMLRFYRSAIVPNLYLRAKYNNVGSSDVRFSMNLIRHLVE